MRFLAKRFAAKEAVAKALGTGIGHGVSFRHIAISHDDRGRPLVQLHEGAAARLAALQACECLLSLSDERHYVIAVALLQGS